MPFVRNVNSVIFYDSRVICWKIARKVFNLNFNGKSTKLCLESRENVIILKLLLKRVYTWVRAAVNRNGKWQKNISRSRGLWLLLGLANRRKLHLKQSFNLKRHIAKAGIKRSFRLITFTFLKSKSN